MSFGVKARIYRGVALFILTLIFLWLSVYSAKYLIILATCDLSGGQGVNKVYSPPTSD